MKPRTAQPLTTSLTQNDSGLTIEWPTVFLAIGIYASWLAVTFFNQSLPDIVLFILGGWLIAWQSSLQHETIHGHPTRNRLLNYLFGAPPLALWLPYEIYRLSHLHHHRDETLTNPNDDPESKYWDPLDWESLTAVGRLVAWAQAPLLGRLILGPMWSVYLFISTEFKAILRGDYPRLKVWFWHALSTVPVLIWLTCICDLSIGKYLLFFVYPGTSVLLLRSFAEHLAAVEVKHRTAIVENASILGLLFLNNNLHAVHHRHPSVAWYQLPEKYLANRETFLSENGGLVYHGYGEVLQRFLLQPHDQILYPLYKESR
jgi:fatty acid desaturase